MGKRNKDTGSSGPPFDVDSILAAARAESSPVLIAGDYYENFGGPKGQGRLEMGDPALARLARHLYRKHKIDGDTHRHAGCRIVVRPDGNCYVRIVCTNLFSKNQPATFVYDLMKE